QLLGRGFEVIGDVIYAGTEQEAIDKFNSGMTYPLEEYTRSDEIGGIFYFFKGIFEEVRDRLAKKA
ncbi:MAG: hypothetical protein ACRC6G_13450, partial [Deefgea sp.]